MNDDDEPGFPYLLFCPIEVYAPAQHNKTSCPYCLEKETSMKDHDALKVLLSALFIFTEAQQLFSEEFWKEMSNFLAESEPPIYTWNDIQDFYYRLKAFAQQEGVQL